MNFKKLTFFACLAGLTGCHTIPSRTVIVQPAVIKPAPLVVVPQPTTTVIVSPASPLFWIGPRHPRCIW